MRPTRLQPQDVSGGIDLTKEHLRQLARVEAERAGRLDHPFGLYVFAHDDPGAELARAVERRVFDDAFGNTPTVMAAEYDPYERTSIFTCIVDHRRFLPIAACRYILPGGLGWKTLDDLPRYWGVPGPMALDRIGVPVDPRRLWDCASLAVEPSYRRGFITQALFASMSALAQMCDVQIIVAMVDCRVLRLAQAICGRPWAVIDGFEPRSYLESPATVPIWTDVAAYRERLLRGNGALYRTMFDSSFFEPALAGLDPTAVARATDRIGVRPSTRVG